MSFTCFYLSGLVFLQAQFRSILHVLLVYRININWEQKARSSCASLQYYCSLLDKYLYLYVSNCKMMIVIPWSGRRCWEYISYDLCKFFEKVVPNCTVWRLCSSLLTQHLYLEPWIECHQKVVTLLLAVFIS